MTRSYKIVCIFLLCMARYIFFVIKVIRRLIGLIYENIAKMANKIFNVPNHLNIILWNAFYLYFVGVKTCLSFMSVKC